ncbi:MAG: hypothetical protein HXX17_11165 [Geobacteraceae bacterium]|nr:hypothetical protein [Geobacteraceae bacterium]
MPDKSHDIFNRIKPLIPLIAAFIFTLILLIFAICQYETNDDMTMIRLLSGKNGLGATPDAVFLSLPLGAILYKHYQLAGNVPWYGLFLYSSLISGCAVGLKIILGSTTATANRIICTIAFLGFYSHLVCQLNFAGVSLFLWLVAIAAISQSSLNHKNCHGEYLIYGLMLAVSFLIRPDILLVSLVFSAPAFATLPFSSTKRKLTALLVPLLMALAISTACNRAYRATPEYRTYAEFNKSRSDLLDLHSGEPTGKTVAAMASVDWNIYDYILAGDWWLHDGSLYNKESFVKFTGQNSSNFSKMVSTDTSTQAANRFKLPLTIIAICLLSSLFSNCQISRLKGREFYAVSGSAVITLGAVLLMSAIRFPPRVALPVSCYLVLLLVIASTIFTKRTSQIVPLRICIATACIIAVTGGTLFMLKDEYHKRFMAGQIKGFTDTTLRQVVNNTPSDTVMISANITGFSYNSEATHPLSEFRNSLPLLDFPGSWLIASPAYNSFLQKNGFGDRTRAVPRMINNDRVLFSYWQSPTENFELFSNNFLAHLNGRYSAEFPGKTFRIVPLFDNRGTSGNFGWIFFRVNAVAQ